MTTFEKIKQAIVEAEDIAPDDILPTSSLSSLGIESLSRAALVLELEELFGVELGDDILYRLPTLQDLATHIDAQVVKV